MESYKDPLIPDEKLLTGYGNNFIDTGYFYAPYIPIIQTPVVLDPNTCATKRGILTRYGKKISKQVSLSPNVNKKASKEYRSITDDWEVSCTDE